VSYTKRYPEVASMGFAPPSPLSPLQSQPLVSPSPLPPIPGHQPPSLSHYSSTARPDVNIPSGHPTPLELLRSTPPPPPLAPASLISNSNKPMGGAWRLPWVFSFVCYQFALPILLTIL
jgi:hypothetical protein